MTHTASTKCQYNREHFELLGSALLFIFPVSEKTSESVSMNEANHDVRSMQPDQRVEGGAKEICLDGQVVVDVISLYHSMPVAREKDAAQQHRRVASHSEHIDRT